MTRFQPRCRRQEAPGGALRLKAWKSSPGLGTPVSDTAAQAWWQSTRLKCHAENGHGEGGCQERSAHELMGHAAGLTQATGEPQGPEDPASGRGPELSSGQR